MFLHKNSFKLIALMISVQCSIQDIIFDSQRVYKLSNTKKYDTGVPIGMIKIFLYLYYVYMVIQNIESNSKSNFFFLSLFVFKLSSKNFSLNK